MFSSLQLFSQVQCPKHDVCPATSCIFLHEKQRREPGLKPVKRDKSIDDASVDESWHSPQREASKRVKKDQVTTQQNTTPLGNVEDGDREARKDSSLEQESCLVTSISTYTVKEPANSDELVLPHKSSTSPTSRPYQAGKTEHAAKDLRGKEPEKQVLSLNPAILPNPPASHSIRTQLVKLLHHEIRRLNEKVANCDDPHYRGLVLSDTEMIRLALSEEETIAKSRSSVYNNVVKARILKLRKTPVDEWIKIRRQSLSKVSLEQKVNTLAESPLEEPSEGLRGRVTIPKDLCSSSQVLTEYDYVLKCPSVDIREEITKSSDSSSWQQCDRCECRFQVFPDRQKNGLLISGGKCRYHPFKLRRAAAETGSGSTFDDFKFPCCNNGIESSSGCATAPRHVYKIYEPLGLASVMQFLETPNNTEPRNKGLPIAIDCEMGYTTLGMELIRLTIVAWPDNRVLEDVLVRPMGEILDLNTRFSGVSSQRFFTASKALDEKPTDISIVSAANQPPSDSSIIDSPASARALLHAYLKPSTPIIGHAVENDLRACRMIHQSIVDTSIIFPHPLGAPHRYSLKTLAKRYLQRDIQTAGPEGHDSKEDACAAGDLVSYKIGQLRRSQGLV